MYKIAYKAKYIYYTELFESKKCVMFQLSPDDGPEDMPDDKFPFKIEETELEGNESGQAWYFGVTGLDYEEARYYNFLIVLQVCIYFKGSVMP